MERPRFQRRNVGKRKPELRLYIFTEGERTEPNYFKAKRLEIGKPTIKIEILGEGYNTLSLVKYAEEYLDKDGVDLTDASMPSECWVVFDKDSFDRDFPPAIVKATSLGYKVAYSNEAFELWYVLHFEYLNSQITRSDYSNKLTKLLHKKYEKNDPGIYELIKDSEPRAINFAKKLDNEFSSVKNPNDRNPSTRVYKLVERLNSIRDS